MEWDGTARGAEDEVRPFTAEPFAAEAVTGAVDEAAGVGVGGDGDEQDEQARMRGGGLGVRLGVEAAVRVLGPGEGLNEDEDEDVLVLVDVRRVDKAPQAEWWAEEERWEEEALDLDAMGLSDDDAAIRVQARSDVAE